MDVMWQPCVQMSRHLPGGGAAVAAAAVAAAGGHLGTAELPRRRRQRRSTLVRKASVMLRMSRCGELLMNKYSITYIQ